MEWKCRKFRKNRKNNIPIKITKLLHNFTRWIMKKFSVVNIYFLPCLPIYIRLRPSHQPCIKDAVAPLNNSIQPSIGFSSTWCIELYRSKIIYIYMERETYSYLQSIYYINIGGRSRAGMNARVDKPRYIRRMDETVKEREVMQLIAWLVAAFGWPFPLERARRHTQRSRTGRECGRAGVR